MVVPMEKLSLLIFYKDYRQFLGALRERGVVHIHENKKRSAEDEKLKQKMLVIRRIGEMIRRLQKRRPEIGVVQPPIQQGMELLAFLEEQYRRLELLDQQIAGWEKEGAVYEPWGDFQKDRIAGLQDAGWDLRFFTVPDRKYKPEWEEKYNAFPVNQEKGLHYFVTVTPQGEKVLPDADPVVFPQATAGEIRERIAALQEERKIVGRQLDAVAVPAAEELKNYRVSLYEDADELKVDDASEVFADDKVIALEGWVPAAIKTDTDRWLSDKGVYYEFASPSVTDNPPILLKNNKFARLFEFIGELYSLPNYREIDLTPFFAPFFVLFFGFCLGDAGYGVLLLIGISVYKIWAKPKFKPILSLAQWLGAATVVMGIVSGTFFGIQLLEVQVPWVVRMRALMLDSQQLFNLALIIGVVQIIFGMFLKVANLWRRYGLPAAFSTIGWLILILGEGLCYTLSLKGYEVRIPMYIVAGVAGAFIFLFNNLKRNIFINIGAGLWDTYNTATGLLGDILSYIRLFALGISSAVLGLVFNDLAVNMSGDIPVVKQLVMIIILLFGHSVNLFMAGLGSFVHPMRLTFVEFYKNAGFEGGGKKYQPFQRRKEN